MAQRSIFAFDDDEERYEGGGFSEPPKEPDNTDQVETDPEGASLEPEAIETPPAKADEPQDAHQQVPEIEKADPLADWRKQNQEQYDFLRDQMIRMNQELAETKKKLEDATRAPIEKPTEADWVNDPTAAAEKLIQAKRAEDEARAAAERKARLELSQAESIRKVLDVAPIFKTDPALQADLNREFYSNPAYLNDPDGPFKAAQAVARRHYKPPEQPKAGTPEPTPQDQQTPVQPPSNQSVEDSAAKAERARAAMAKKNVMHGGGKSKAKVTSIDPKLAALARQHGVSIETIKLMEGIE